MHIWGHLSQMRTSSVSMLMLGMPGASLALQLPSRVAHSAVVAPRAAAPAMIDFDMSTVLGLGAAFIGIGGGIGLIALTENAGKRNDAQENAQPCVECRGVKVTTCTICKGDGSDPLAKYVSSVREMAGEEGGTVTSIPKVEVDDWEAGSREVVMFGEILKDYPVKATGEDACINCDGRGVIVCDNCQGSGIQPRFLERYSPDDFMD